jgi:hypothetical protein
VLTRLLPKYLEFTIFSAMLETDAAFFAAQLIAMSNATDNAKKLIDELTLADEQSAPSGDHHGNARNRRRRRSASRLTEKDMTTPFNQPLTAKATGKVVQVLGNVVDVEFSRGHAAERSTTR